MEPPATLPTLVLRFDPAHPVPPEHEVAGLPLVLRTVLGFRAGGIGRVVLVGEGPDASANAAALRADRRVTVEVEAVTSLPQLEGPMVVCPAELCLHRDLARRLAKLAVTATSSARLGLVEHELLVVPGSAAEPAPESTAELALEAPEFAVPARTAAERARATHLSVEALRKPIDGIVSRHLNRHVSLFVTRRLMGTGIHPNVISLLTMAMGFAAAYAAARGDWSGAVVGGLLFQASSILDGVDGELARLKYLGSRTGEWLDTVSDDLGVVLFFAGASIGVWRSTGASWPVWVGGAAVFGILLERLIDYTLLIVVFRSGDLLKIPWLADAGRPDLSRATGIRKLYGWVTPLLKHDFYVFLFMALAFANRLDWVLWIGAFGSMASMVGGCVHAARMKRTAGAEARASA
jgi:hypothetical protein